MDSENFGRERQENLNMIKQNAFICIYVLMSINLIREDEQTPPIIQNFPPIVCYRENDYPQQKLSGDSILVLKTRVASSKKNPNLGKF
jgi:hypothetical protein